MVKRRQYLFSPGRTMTPQVSPPREPEIQYPESDGLPMADNTLQFQGIVTIEGNLDAMYPPEANVFVAGDQFWYPVKGRPDIRVAPDTLAVFGRPKGYRGSYKQWMEDGIAPQVVFEVLSPNNTPAEMDGKFAFYEKYGVEDYYLFDPDNNVLRGWRRVRRKLKAIPNLDGWVSPRLQIRFDLSSGELVIYRPDGQRFLTFVELMQRKDEMERLVAEAQGRAERLAEQLRRLGVDPEQ